MVREWLIRVPDDLAKTFSAIDGQWNDRLMAALTDADIGLKHTELCSAVWVDPEQDETIKSRRRIDPDEPPADLVRDEWPYVRVFSEQDPTDLVLAMLGTPDIDARSEQRMKLLDFVRKTEDKTVTEADKVEALAALISFVVGDKGR